MKKYVKPEIFIEKYELSSHVANCYLEVNNNDGYTCSAVADDNSGIAIFLTKGICTQVVEPTGTFEGYCYMNSADGLITFNS